MFQAASSSTPNLPASDETAPVPAPAPQAEATAAAREPDTLPTVTEERASVQRRFKRGLGEKRQERSHGAQPKPRGQRPRTTDFDIGMVTHEKSATTAGAPVVAVDEATPMDSSASEQPAAPNRPAAAAPAPAATGSAPMSNTPAEASSTPASAPAPAPAPAAPPAGDAAPPPGPGQADEDLEAELERLRKENAAQAARLEAQEATIRALDKEARKAKKTIAELKAELEHFRLEKLGEAISSAALEHDIDDINYFHLKLSSESRYAYMRLKDAGRHKVNAAVAEMILEVFNGAATEVLRRYGMSISQVSFNLHKPVKTTEVEGDHVDGLSEIERKSAYHPEAQMSLYFKRDYKTGEP